MKSIQHLTASSLILIQITIFADALIRSHRYPKSLINLVRLILYRALQR